MTLRERRIKALWGLREIAREIGVHPFTIASWEAGKTPKRKMAEYRAYLKLIGGEN